MMMRIRCSGYYDVNGKRLVADADIAVEDGKIAEIAPWGAPLGSGDLDLSGNILLPGLVDAHNHLCFDIGDEVAQISEPLGYQALVAARNARLAIDSGVTTLRDAGERDYVDFSVKRGIEEGLIPGPRLIVAGPGLMRTGGHMWYMGEEVDGEVEARKGVRRQMRSGVDYVKIFVSGGATSQRTGVVTPEMTKAEICTLIEEAHLAGKCVGAHTHGGIAATWSIEAGVDSVEHGCFLTDEQLAAMKEKNTFLVSTSGIQRAIRDYEKNPSFMRSKAGDAYANYLDVIAKAIRLGIRIAVGNDTNHGCIAEEIEFLVRAGASPEDALFAATMQGASLCGLSAIIGSIEIGKEADFVAVGHNPLKRIEALRDPLCVIKSGRILRTAAAFR